MANVMEQLLDKLDNGREQLLIALEPLPDEALLTPNAVGDWSIAALLAVLTAWEAEMVTALLKLDQGKKPERLLAALDNQAEFNQHRVAETYGRPLDRVFDDLMKVRLQLEEWLETFSDRQLTDKKRYKWFNGRSLAQIIAQTSYENEALYLPTVQKFARSWEQAANNGVIPLTAVSANGSNQLNKEFPDEQSD
ncbi:MAG TPA: ClbS/DfsB family four-helix bundle protein [Anaerolineae bacterium]|nr:ClbS/DfsB family four-helix bundle protein [Anaerolineae bacterium]